MTEGRLKSGLIKEFRTLPQCVAIPHTEQSIHGVPDLSVTWCGKTTWLEIKFLKPNAPMAIRGNQHFMMLNLQRAGSAFYVVYDKRGNPPSTIICQPSQLRENECVIQEEGIRHDIVVAFIRRLHTDDQYRP